MKASKWIQYLIAPCFLDLSSPEKLYPHFSRQRKFPKLRALHPKGEVQPIDGCNNSIFPKIKAFFFFQFSKKYRGSFPQPVRESCVPFFYLIVVFVVRSSICRSLCDYLENFLCFEQLAFIKILPERAVLPQKENLIGMW